MCEWQRPQYNFDVWNTFTILKSHSYYVMLFVSSLLRTLLMQFMTLLLKTARASLFSSCWSSSICRSCLRSSSSVTSSMLSSARLSGIRCGLWRIRRLQRQHLVHYLVLYLFVQCVKVFLFLLGFLAFVWALLQKYSFSCRNL